MALFPQAGTLLTFGLRTYFPPDEYVLTRAFRLELRRGLDHESHVGPCPRDVLRDPVLLLRLLHRRPHPPLRPRLRAVRAQVRQGLGKVLLHRQVQVHPRYLLRVSAYDYDASHD